MFRKMLFALDQCMGRIARKAYKEDGTDTLRVRVLDAIANFICWLDITLIGRDKVYEALLEYANAEREKAIANGTYNDFECVDMGV